MSLFKINLTVETFGKTSKLSPLTLLLVFPYTIHTGLYMNTYFYITFNQFQRQFT